MDQLICASLSHTHYWYEVDMLKVPANSIMPLYSKSLGIFSMYEDNMCSNLSPKRRMIFNNNNNNNNFPLTGGCSEGLHAMR